MAVGQPSAFGRTPYYVLTGGLAIIFLFPLLWSLYASLSPQPGTAQTDGFGLGNYKTMFEFGPGLPVVALNSVIISALTVALTLIISTLGGYAFARFRFWGKDALFLLTLSILMVPYATAAHPALRTAQYTWAGQFAAGRIADDRHVPIALRHLHDAHLLRGHPARSRGIGLHRRLRHFGVLWRIMLPAVVPGLVTVGLFAFLAAWNDFFAPLILLTDPTKQPLPVAVANMRQQTMGVINYGATEAGVVAMAVPCVILFLLLQRYYVRGFMSGAVKG